MSSPRASLLISFGALLLAALIALVVGAGLSMGDIWQGLREGPASKSPIASILWQIRIPRILMAGSCGWMLAASGVGFQAVLRNPLADPYITGIAGGAAVGAAIALLFGLAAFLGGFAATAFAFVGAFGGALLVYSIARSGGRTQVGTFLLAGLAVGSLLWAVITLLLILANQPFERIIFWLMGSFTLADWPHLAVCVAVGAIGVAGLWTLARPLNVYALGEESAASLGVDVERLKGRVLLFGSLATAAAVSVAGIIGFVGLIVPHIARRMVGAGHGLLYPASGLLGATLLILADTLARTALPPREIPVGVLTAILGAPFFIGLVRRRL